MCAYAERKLHIMCDLIIAFCRYTVSTHYPELLISASTVQTRGSESGKYSIESETSRNIVRLATGKQENLMELRS